jgi:hypothetical protein
MPSRKIEFMEGGVKVSAGHLQLLKEQANEMSGGAF